MKNWRPADVYFSARKHVAHEKPTANDENNRNSLNIDEIPKLLNQLDLNGKNDHPTINQHKNTETTSTVRSAAVPAAPALPPKSAVVTKPKPCSSAASTLKPQNRPITRSQSLKENGDKASVKSFNVYNYAERYAAQKEAKMKKITAEEKQRRQFHSRPAPDFVAARKKMDEQFQQNRKLPTCPDSPQVYKNSKEMIERRNKKVK